MNITVKKDGQEHTFVYSKDMVTVGISVPQISMHKFTCKDFKDKEDPTSDLCWFIGGEQDNEELNAKALKGILAMGFEEILPPVEVVEAANNEFKQLKDESPTIETVTTEQTK